ncbi:MAG: Kae1-associated serine/threonine protein kinase [Vulcanisaeta sp.]|nr:Kae1-associated serine/threonine protein kinase [Vulcanisaeta sp.]
MEGRRIIAVGAEAILYLEDWLGLTVLVKERVPKGYRRAELDNYIRKLRTINEARAMIRARKLGIPVPRIYDVDLVNMRIRMEYLRGTPLVKLITTGEVQPQVLNYLYTMGKYLGLLHGDGLVHGDPTPANALIVGDELYLIDFGLAEFLGRRPRNNDVRALYKLAIDLNVMLRSLEALRKDLSQRLFNEFFQGYSETLGAELASRAYQFMTRIRRMVRYAVR